MADRHPTLKESAAIAAAQEPVPSGSVRAVALFEAAKGALVVLAGAGLLSLLRHHDITQLAESLIHHLNLRPTSHLPGVFLKVAAGLSGPHERLLALGAGLYAVVRFVEAWGLWFHRRWAEWFAVASGALYIPFEVRELAFRPNVLAAVVLAGNVVVVAILVLALRRRKLGLQRLAETSAAAAASATASAAEAASAAEGPSRA